MPPDTNTRPSVGEKELWFGGHKDKERLGNYWVLGEVGRGSFATVSKAYRSKSKEIVAIKAVARQKLTSKLLENLESEINILKQIRHKNIVLLEDCFKNDHHIYLVMEYCTGSDLAVYIKGRGRLETLDFVPRPGSHISTANPSAGNKIFWPHPASGGIDERVTRNFLGQLAAALKFLRTMDLIHRDLKPQNLLLHPPSAADLAEGHPLGIPILKVADFGFARILPAAAMAETLCGSPLYMAPEILRYEKYDAKVDLWSVGAVLFEMTVGKAPFRANNHVELLKKIERGEDRIKFPDEGRPDSRDSKEGPPGDPVSLDIKTLIRQLLRRKPIQRMSFDDFFTCGVWDGYMVETSDDGSTSLEASTDSSAVNFESESSDSRLRSMVQSLERSRDQLLPKHAPQPLSVDPALNPQPAPFARDRAARESSAPTPTPPAASPVAEQALRPIRRTEPKYYVSDDIPASEVERPASVISNVTVTEKANPRPISNTHRRVPSREYGSLDEPRLVTPTSNNTTTPLPSRQRIGEGSPLAATPPMTMPLEDTGKSDRDSGDSLVGRDYVVVEKQNVEVNALADELEQASRRPNTVARRPSSHTSIVTRPVSAFRPSSSSPTTTTTQALIPAGHTPPFALPTTPPFAMQTSSSPLPRRTSGTTLSRPPSYQNGLNIFPPPIHPLAQDMQAPRLSVSPSSLQSGALARALANTALRIYNTGTATAATAIAKATARRRPTIVRTSAELDAQEDEILHIAEDIARKAFVLLELADSRLALWQSLARPPSQQTHLSSTPPFASVRRRSSGSSVGSEVTALRQAEAAISEAVVLYWKAMTIIFRGTTAIQRYWDRRAERYERYEEYTLSPELNEMAQWLRARFNECHEKLEWSKARSADDLPFVDKLVHDHARETSRQAAMAELRSNMSEAQAGYETSLWLLEALLDSDGDNGAMSQDDRQSVEKLMIPIKSRLESLKQKMSDTESQAPPPA